MFLIQIDELYCFILVSSPQLTELNFVSCLNKKIKELTNGHTFKADYQALERTIMNMCKTGAEETSCEETRPLYTVCLLVNVVVEKK